MDKKKKNDYQIIYDEHDPANPKRKRKPKPVYRSGRWLGPVIAVLVAAALFGLGLLVTQAPDSHIVSPTRAPVLPTPFPTLTTLLNTVPVVMTAAPATPPPSPEATVISRWIEDVDWSPTTNTLAVAIWDAGQASLQLRPTAFSDSLFASPEQITSIPAGRDHMTNVALSPDGKLVAASGDTVLRLWDVGTGAERSVLDGSGSPEFSPNGNMLAFATGGYEDNHTVRLLDTATSTEITTLQGMPHAWSVAFSPDGQSLAVSDWDRVSVWFVDDLQAPWLIESVNPGWARDLAFSHDGRLLAVATNGWIAIFDLQSQGLPGYSLQSPLGDVWSLAFSPDGTKLAAAVGDHASGMAQIWDVATGQPLAALQGHRHRVTGIAYSPDGRQLVTSSHDGSLRLWDAETGAELSTLQL